MSLSNIDSVKSAEITLTLAEVQMVKLQDILIGSVWYNSKLTRRLINNYKKNPNQKLKLVEPVCSNFFKIVHLVLNLNIYSAQRD